MGLGPGTWDQLGLGSGWSPREPSGLRANSLSQPLRECPLFPGWVGSLPEVFPAVSLSHSRTLIYALPQIVYPCLTLSHSWGLFRWAALSHRIPGPHGRLWDRGGASGPSTVKPQLHPGQGSQHVARAQPPTPPALVINAGVLTPTIRFMTTRCDAILESVQRQHSLDFVSWPRCVTVGGPTLGCRVGYWGHKGISVCDQWTRMLTWGLS